MTVIVRCSHYKKFMTDLQLHLNREPYANLIRSITNHLRYCGFQTVVYSQVGNWTMSDAEYTLFLLRWS